VPRRFRALRSRDFELPSFRSQKVKFQPATVSSLLLLDIGASMVQAALIPPLRPKFL
jgi:hypothetical protein